MPPYRQVANELRARIESADLAPGARVPSITTLMQEYGMQSEISRYTVLVGQNGTSADIQKLAWFAGNGAPASLYVRASNAAATKWARAVRVRMPMGWPSMV